MLIKPSVPLFILVAFALPATASVAAAATAQEAGWVFNDAITVAAAAGAVTGFIGATAAILSKQRTFRDAAFGAVSGIGFGAGVPTLMVYYWSVHPAVAATAGFIAGMMAFGLATGIMKLGENFGESPVAFLVKVWKLRPRLVSGDQADAGKETK